MTNTVKPWTMTGTCAGEQITLLVLAARYAANERLAVQLYTDEGEPYGDLSINVPQIPLQEGQIIINHDLDDEILAIATRSGLLRTAADRTVRYGMATSRVHSLTPRAKRWLADLEAH